MKKEYIIIVGEAGNEIGHISKVEALRDAAIKKARRLVAA